ncbi:uncharacterized protein LOC118280896 [Spodoptera frugiperda]|uniref:Uncharacterized protein LOC118280896 n=1 Tax=Spodoptera frugiperda TaxID=7108 RepID=A0A9R0E0B6_SPOFR|nr:uncharacterized protein LOC118280896 [Spodoptera frugiperda]
MGGLRYYTIFILYIYLHQTVNAENNNINEESLLTKYAKLFKQRRYEDIVTDIRHIFKERTQNGVKDDQKLNELITDVTTAIGLLKTKLVKLDKDGVLTLDPEPILNENRYKRSVDNETVEDANNVSLENVTETDSGITDTTDKIESVTEESLKVNNNTSEVNVTNDTDDGPMPTRRSWPIKDVAPPFIYEITPSNRYDITPQSNYEVTPQSRIDVTPSNYDVTSQSKFDVTPQSIFDMTTQSNYAVKPQAKYDVTPQSKYYDVTPKSTIVDITPKSRIVDVTPKSRYDMASHLANDIANPKMDVQSRIKGKLISYLEDTFNDIEKKISPLSQIKATLSSNSEYRIGYIIANIDTLDVNLKKWKNNMLVNQHTWDDETILNLFDKIKATNAVTTSLIESLKRQLPGSKELNHFAK